MIKKTCCIYLLVFFMLFYIPCAVSEAIEIEALTSVIQGLNSLRIGMSFSDCREILMSNNLKIEQELYHDAVMINTVQPYMNNELTGILYETNALIIFSENVGAMLVLDDPEETINDQNRPDGYVPFVFDGEKDDQYSSDRMNFKLKSVYFVVYNSSVNTGWEWASATPIDLSQLEKIFQYEEIFEQSEDYVNVY